MATADEIRIRGARAQDGANMWRVVNAADNLDANSSYLYLLLARDFAQTCVVAERNDRLVGFVTGFRRPTRLPAAFLWQIGVLPEAQGSGLGKRMVHAFLQQPAVADANYLETTVAPSNQASRALFRSIARALGAELTVKPCFAVEAFPDPGHEAEELLEIGPFDHNQIANLPNP